MLVRRLGLRLREGILCMLLLRRDLAEPLLGRRGRWCWKLCWLGCGIWWGRGGRGVEFVYPSGLSLLYYWHCKDAFGMASIR